MREAIRSALEVQGYVVLEARDGREALGILFADHAPDVRLIISDLEMPAMTGTEMLQVLSSYSRSSRIPVIIVSVTHPPRRPRLHQKVSEWLVKPFDMDKLLELVGRRFLPSRATP